VGIGQGMDRRESIETTLPLKRKPQQSSEMYEEI
jgi:hypothetical protein